MAKSENQRLKLLYLREIFLQKTDAYNKLTIEDIRNELEKYDIKAERKSLYTDIAILQEFGLNIQTEQQGRAYYYYVEKRDFELAELKLLVEAVQSSRFITSAKSDKLIKKLEGLASESEGKELQRQVHVTKRIKTLNESIYKNVKIIHKAIDENCRIQYKYYQWNVKKEMELKHNGKIYEVSPWALSWKDDNYYLVAYDKSEEKIKHFRVDKLTDISLTNNRREGRKHFENFDPADYAQKNFGMFGGDVKSVKMEFENRLIGVVLDRFGCDIPVIKTDKEHFYTRVDITVSQQFFGWIVGLGKGAKILGPEDVVEMMKNDVQRLVEQYSVNGMTK